jgi:hypothetical protein
MKHWTFLWALGVVLLTLGCSTHARRVDCEGEMVAINTPAASSMKAKDHEEGR